MIGETIGRYRVDDFLGAGGMGEVWLATDTDLKRAVALKVLPPQLVSDPQRRERFIREARLVAGLSHPHIATIYEILEHDGRLVLAMEYVRGENLRQIARHGLLSVKRILDIGEQIAGALGAAHRRGIIHRDVKPDNILVDREGMAKLLDFGLARLRAEVAGSDEAEDLPTLPGAITESGSGPETRVLSDTGTVPGTAPYMSPEQASGQGVGPESDIFSLGVTLYELSTGRKAFDGDTPAALMAAVLRDTLPPPRNQRADLPPELDVILARALAKEIVDRYHDARDMASDLKAVRLRIESAETGSGIVLLAQGGRRRRSVWVAGVVVVLAAVAGAIWWFSAGEPLRPTPAPGAETMTLVLASPEPLDAPVLSPDGKTVVYLAEEEGRPDLFLRRVAGGPALRLTDDEAWEDDPAFSPDSEHIAFTRRGEVPARLQIVIIPALGGEPQYRIRDAENPAWSPEGQRIAFIHRDPSRERYAICTTRVDGADLRVALPGDAVYPFFHDVAWSHDGQSLAVIRSTGGGTGEIWLVPASGGQPRRLGDDPPTVSNHNPSFTPDGEGILHSSNRTGAVNLWVMPLDGGSPRRITTGSGPDTGPTIARDGTIAYLNDRSRTALLVHHFDSGRTDELLTHSDSLWAPTFSPDGRELAFSREEATGRWEIWTMPAEGGTPRPLTSGPKPALYPRYTPDGTSVLYSTWTGGSDRLRIIPRDGGPARAPWPDTGLVEAFADISPDGRQIAFTRIEEDQPHIWIASVDGKEARRLTHSPSTMARWSPDGRRLAFAPDRSFRSGIWMINADGSEERRLTETGGWPVWWPDGSRIGYQVVEADGKERLYTVSPEGGPSRPLDVIRYEAINCPFDLSPDGTKLVTTNQVHVLSEIWLLHPPRPE
jgi:Tol biopolymer transport system component/tRNA A-37 threonylcarbamoyl transferase component Bud32